MSFTMTDKKLKAHEVVTIRTARSGDYAPLVLPLPRSIADAIKCDKGDKVHIYTDGEKIYIERLEEPKL
jgi:hypothetical protein